MAPAPTPAAEATAPAPRALATSPDGTVLVRSRILPSDPEAACPDTAIEVPDGDGWRTLHEVQGVATVAIGPKGQVGGFVSCAEHWEATFVDEWLGKHDGAPAFATGLLWEGLTMTVMGKDAGQPARPFLFARRSSGWERTSVEACTPLTTSDSGTASWADPRGNGQPQTWTIVWRDDLDEDGEDEYFLTIEEAGLVSRPYVLVSSCGGGRARDLWLADAPSATLQPTSTYDRGWPRLELRMSDSRSEETAESTLRYMVKGYQLVTP